MVLAIIQKRSALAMICPRRPSAREMAVEGVQQSMLLASVKKRIASASQYPHSQSARETAIEGVL